MTIKGNDNQPLLGNSKSQITNNKQITMTKIQNTEPVSVIEYWNLKFVCNLVLVIWNFYFPSTVKTDSNRGRTTYCPLLGVSSFEVAG